MSTPPLYRLDRATLPDGSVRLVIVNAEDLLHSASSWLSTLADLGRSPHTIKSYGARVVAYLNWTSPTADWRAVSIGHLVLWRRTLSAGGRLKPSTVNISLIALRSFYEWADASGFLASNILQHLTELKYFPAGTNAGGEHGAYRRVTAARLMGPRDSTDHLARQWISDAHARERLETLSLNKRDRLLVDLFYFTGIRAGEALSLFTADMHLGGGSRSSGCTLRDPHFHVRTTNPVTNGARAKGVARVLYCRQSLVDAYIDYVVERARVLGDNDRSPHMLVNLYGHGDSNGEAMKDSRVREVVKECGRAIDFPLTGAHMLRHTFATRLAQGIDCEAQPTHVVQAILGHRSPSSTQVYTHDMEAAKLQALMEMPSRRVDLHSEA